MFNRIIKSRFVWVGFGLWLSLGSSLSISSLLLADDAEKKPSQAETAPIPAPVEPPTKAELAAAIEKGKAFLLANQNHDGSWGSATRTKELNIYAPVPGGHHAFRGAVTALCVSALIELNSKEPEVQTAIDRGEAWLLEKLPSLRRANHDALYNIWGHAYGIEALARLHKIREGDEEKRKLLIAEIQRQIELLDRYESVNGGWGYYDFDYHLKKPTTQPTSFTTATVLCAFHEAKKLGCEVPQRLIDRGITAIIKQQRPDLAYLYSADQKNRPANPINRPGGSVGRSQACNYTLRLFGHESITDDALIAWSNRLFSRELWLDIGRKRPIPHEAWFQIAGYFFYYGHYYAAFAIDQIPEDKQPPLRAQLAHVILKLQEKDGSWWDYPLYNYHQPYGTAFALMTLKKCESVGK
jgi:hypothetical protein